MSKTTDATPTAVVQRQVDAYNRRDLDAFMATYSDSARLFRMPATEASLSGKAQMRDFYANNRFNMPTLHAKVLQRMVIGNKVIDHECITGLQADPIEADAVYEVVDGLIQQVWFFYPQ